MSKKQADQPKKDEQADHLDADALKEKLADMGEQLEQESTAQLEALKKQLEQAQQKAQENWDLALRKEAELQNAKKIADRDVTNARKFGIERFAQDLLAVIDSFEQAKTVEVKDESAKSIMEGMELTYKVLLDVMAKYGLKPINPEGEAFNPEFHEAISMQESDEVEPNKVLFVVQTGFMVHERVLRPARVVVAKAATAKMSDDEK